VTNVLPGSFSDLIVGLRMNPPLDLGIANSPGCLLHVHLIIVVPNQVNGGRATFALPLPNAVPLVGATLPIQATVIDLAHGAGNPLVATTNGLDLKLGLR